MLSRYPTLEGLLNDLSALAAGSSCCLGEPLLAGPSVWPCSSSTGVMSEIRAPAYPTCTFATIIYRCRFHEFPCNLELPSWAEIGFVDFGVDEMWGVGIYSHHTQRITTKQDRTKRPAPGRNPGLPTISRGNGEVGLPVRYRG